MVSGPKVTGENKWDYIVVATVAKKKFNRLIQKKSMFIKKIVIPEKRI